jgi:hypothetical protein
VNETVHAIKEQLESLLLALSARDSAKAAHLTSGIRLPEQEIREALSTEKRELVMVAEDVLWTAAAECSEQILDNGSWCAVELGLMTSDGRSELTLELRVTFRSGRIVMEIDNLHVL